jgi:hypothetical protein
MSAPSRRCATTNASSPATVERRDDGAGLHGCPAQERGLRSPIISAGRPFCEATRRRASERRWTVCGMASGNRRWHARLGITDADTSRRRATTRATAKKACCAKVGPRAGELEALRHARARPAMDALGPGVVSRTCVAMGSAWHSSSSSLGSPPLPHDVTTSAAGERNLAEGSRRKTGSPCRRPAPHPTQARAGAFGG